MGAIGIIDEFAPHRFVDIPGSRSTPFSGSICPLLGAAARRLLLRVDGSTFLSPRFEREKRSGPCGQSSARPRGRGRQYVKRPTVVRRSAAMRDSSSTAVRVWVSAWVVESAAVETLLMFSAI